MNTYVYSIYTKIVAKHIKGYKPSYGYLSLPFITKENYIQNPIISQKPFHSAILKGHFGFPQVLYSVAYVVRVSKD